MAGLARFWPALTADLVAITDAERLAAARKVISTLPPCWRTICFETRLDPQDPRLDLSVAIGADQRGELAAALAQDSPDDTAGVHGVLRVWSQPESPLAAAHHLWLEFDEPGWRDVEDPFVFLTFLDGHWPGLDEMSVIDGAEARRLAALCLKHLGRSNTAPLDVLERAVACLPPTGGLLHLAPLPASRGREDLRLVVGLPWPEVAGWLAAINWPGTRRQLETAEALFRERTPCLQLALDLADAPRPLLGVEASSSSAPWWHELMAQLRRVGVDDGGTESALASWASESPCVRHQGWWLRIQRQASIKVEIAASGRLRAKVYRYARPAYVLGAFAAADDGGAWGEQ